MNTSTNLTHCQWCGQFHTNKCPTVKAIDYYPNGTVKRVEFFGPGDQPTPVIVKPVDPYTPYPNPTWIYPSACQWANSSTNVVLSDVFAVN